MLIPFTLLSACVSTDDIVQETPKVSFVPPSAFENETFTNGQFYQGIRVAHSMPKFGDFLAVRISNIDDENFLETSHQKASISNYIQRVCQQFTNIKGRYVGAEPQFNTEYNAQYGYKPLYLSKSNQLIVVSKCVNEQGNPNT